MDSKKCVIVAIVVVAIAAVAAVAFTGNGGENDDTPSDSTTDLAKCRLVVYGNANNDDFVNSDDLDTVMAIIESGVWDKERNPYADANHDGSVDYQDVQYIKDIIDKKEVHLYYTNQWGGVDFMHYPFSGNIGTGYWEQADLTILLGLWDKVTACGNVSLTDAKNPGWQDRFSYGPGHSVDAETVFKSHKPVSEGGAGVNLMIPYSSADGSVMELRTAVEKTGSDLDILCLPTDPFVRIVTTGFMLDAQERSMAYMDIADSSIAYAEEKLKDIKDPPSVMVVMVKPWCNTGDILVHGNSPTGPNGMYRFMKMTPAEIVDPPNPKFFDHVDIDWVNVQNPDWIVFNGSGLFSTDKGEAVVQQEFEDWSKKLFESTNAYKQGHIIATNNGTMQSYPCAFAYLSLIAPIFDEIDDDYAASIYNKWFDDGYVYYDLNDMPTFKIRYLGEKA